jgi:prolyl-tRNA synthetase
MLQEGNTAHATSKEAEAEVMAMIQLYAAFVPQLNAVM